MKNINVSAIALMLSLFAVGISAADKPGKPDTKQTAGSNVSKDTGTNTGSNTGTVGSQTGSEINTSTDKTGFFASIKGFVSSTYASLASNSSDAWTYVKGHKVKSAIIGAAVVGAAIVVVKKRKQIYKAIMNNPVKTLAVVLGAPVLAYAGYKYFGSPAAAPAPTTPAPTGNNK
jgi:hypothetical protein